MTTLRSLMAFRAKMISEANGRVENGKIVLVEEVSEIPAYLKSHPAADKVGFIVNKTPPEMAKGHLKNPAENVHASPIYYERNAGGKVTFIQLDSLIGHFFLIAASENSSEAQQFFNPFPRQTSGIGCFADALVVLLILLKTVGIVSFCEQNSNPIEMKQQEETLAPAAGKSLSALSMKPKGITKVSALTVLPPCLFHRIERFDLMRQFRVNHPALFKLAIPGNVNTTYGDQMIQRAILRYPRLVNRQVLKQNLNSSDKCYDFQGDDFAETHRSMEQFLENREQRMFRLFSGKFRKLLVVAREADQIAKAVSRFMVKSC